ncbi:MAG: molybdopterin-dependent oxidoreductase [Hyphomicrobiales bacterium]
MSSIAITINGQKVTARPGETILQAAQAAGIDIPTLCHHPALAPIGACRVCLVEVSGQRTLQPACTFPVADRMEIQTESPKVVRARKFVLELLFSERNHFCMACEMSGGCELQNLGYRYGLDHWVYPTYTERLPVDASPAHHAMDHNRCVLCRRCTRACAELVANHTLDLRQRGAHTMLCADMDVPLGDSSCIGCGTCVNVCPTGALIDKRSAFMARPDAVDRVGTICTQCSVGCGLNVVMHRGHVLRLESRWDAPVSGGLLCRRGRFEALEDRRPRLLEPMIRENGCSESASWNRALAEAARHLFNEAPERLGLLTSTRLTSEALGLLHVIFAKHLRSAQRCTADGPTPVLPFAPCGKLADIAGSDLILLVAADPVQDQPVASFFIKRAVDQGARLVTVESRPTELSPFAEATFAPQDMGIAVDLVQAAAHPVVLYGANLTKTGAKLLQKVETKARFIPLVRGVNTVTATALGLNNRLDPAACSTLFIVAGEENGTLDQMAARISSTAFVIVQACYASPLTERADLLLPMASWLERSGTFTNTDGTLLRAHAALPPSGQSRPDWDILGRLAERLGLDASVAKAEFPQCGS